MKKNYRSYQPPSTSKKVKNIKKRKKLDKKEKVKSFFKRTTALVILAVSLMAIDSKVDFKSIPMTIEDVERVSTTINEYMISNNLTERDMYELITEGEIITLEFDPSTKDDYKLGFEKVDEGFKYIKKDLEVLNDSSNKTYMDYRSITSKTSNQYNFIQDNMTIKDGFLYDEYGFMGVALGSYFGEIGDRFIINLDTGKELKLVKIERKADEHTENGFIHKVDKSIIEFVIDTETVDIERGGNGLLANGNFNNLEEFKGKIESIQKIYPVDEKEYKTDIPLNPKKTK